MLNRWRSVTVAALAGGVAVAGQVPAFAGTAVSSPVTIQVTSQLRVVSGDTFVVYHAGSYSRATVTGNLTGAASGETVALLAQKLYPHRRKRVTIATATLSASDLTSYSFTVAPNTATRYKVELLRGSTVLGKSPNATVYVAAGSWASGFRKCHRPVCRETMRVRVYAPPADVKTEMAKRVYAYFGINLSKRGTPPLPKWLTLNGGHARVTKARRVSRNQFEFSVRYSFRIGNHRFSWLPAACTRDTVTRDGLGLPGRHHCGAKRIRSTTYYLGASRR